MQAGVLFTRSRLRDASPAEDTSFLTDFLGVTRDNVSDCEIYERALGLFSRGTGITRDE